MKFKTVCLTSTSQVGVSFLDWSLHWLAGNDQVYIVDQESWSDVPKDPLTRNNAHQHPKNHPSGQSNYINTILELQQTPTESFHSCYPGSIDITLCAQELGIEPDQYYSQDIIKWLITATEIDFAKIVSSSYAHQIPVIYVATNAGHQVYQILSQARDNEHDYEAFHRTYFADKIPASAPVWDQREALALNLQIDNYHVDNKFFDFSGNHLWILADDLWYDTRRTVTKCLDYIGVEVQPQRWAHWHRVLETWLGIQRPMIEFNRNLDHIVSATVRGWNYPLPKLSLFQEAIIQHRLIYQHNLNIRNWQLTQFPDNTNKLHKLLESSQHSSR